LQIKLDLFGSQPEKVLIYTHIYLIKNHFFPYWSGKKLETSQNRISDRQKKASGL